MKKALIAISILFASASWAQSFPSSGIEFSFWNTSGQDVTISLNDESGDSGAPPAPLTCQAAIIPYGGTVICYDNYFIYPSLPKGTIALVSKDTLHRCDYSYEQTFNTATNTYDTIMKLTDQVGLNCIYDYLQGWLYQLNPG